MPTLALAAGVDRELDLAQERLAEGDYAKAYALYRRIAEEERHPLALFVVANFYAFGWGRPVNREAACAWYGRAAEARIPAAAHFFGDCLAAGIPQPVDPAAAAVWYRRAANDGHRMSLCSLGALHLEGRGVERDLELGLALCREAAEEGIVPAQLRMGQLRLEGPAEIRDDDASRRWFEAAAQRGSPEANYRLGVMLREGRGAPADYERARGYFEQAASSGYAAAYLPTAELYFGVSEASPDEKPSPGALVKSYFWTSAAIERAPAAGDRERARALMGRIRSLMPESWAPDLDAKVSRHLVEHPPPLPRADLLAQ